MAARVWVSNFDHSLRELLVVSSEKTWEPTSRLSCRQETAAVVSIAKELRAKS